VVFHFGFLLGFEFQSDGIFYNTTIQSPVEALREGGNYRAAKSWQEKKRKKIRVMRSSIPAGSFP